MWFLYKKKQTFLQPNTSVMKGLNCKGLWRVRAIDIWAHESSTCGDLSYGGSNCRGSIYGVKKTFE